MEADEEKHGGVMGGAPKVQPKIRRSKNTRIEVKIRMGIPTEKVTSTNRSSRTQSYSTGSSIELN